MNDQTAVQVTYSPVALHAGFLNSEACDLCGALVVDSSSKRAWIDGGEGRVAAPQTAHEQHAAFHARLGF